MYTFPFFTHVESVDTTPIKILDDNEKRTSYIIQNLGTVVVYYGEKNNISATTGMRIAASGGTYSCKKGDGDDPRQAVWAYAASAQDVRVREDVEI